MSAPFQPGDVVVCVDDVGAAQLVRRGHYYRVNRWRGRFVVVDGVFGYTGPDGQPGMLPERFRKVNDEQIPEVLARLKSLKTPETADA